MVQISSLCLVLLGVIIFSDAQNRLKEEDEKELLDAHNNLRGMVNPPASNMLQMEWSDELATIAQRYADRCNFDHNSNRHSQSSTYQYVGENLYITSSPIVSYADYVKSWYDEEQFYNYTDNSCSDVCDHYTQMVWAETDAVGCGVRRCFSISGFSAPNLLLLVCNYGPSANVNDVRPYGTGTGPCSECPDDHPVCVDSLCSSNETDTENPDLPNGSGLGTPVGPDEKFSKVQEGTLDGRLQGGTVPATRITAQVDSLGVGRVVWSIMAPDDIDSALYYPIKIGLALPYAWLAALGNNYNMLTTAETIFVATTAITFPSGYQMMVHFTSNGFQTSGVAAYSIRASGFYDTNFNYDQVRVISLMMKQSQSGVVSGYQKLSGGIRVNFMVSQTEMQQSLPFYPARLRVRLTRMGGVIRKRGIQNSLTFSTMSTFSQPPVTGQPPPTTPRPNPRTTRPRRPPPTKPAPRPIQPPRPQEGFEDSSRRRKDRWEKLKEAILNA